MDITYYKKRNILFIFSLKKKIIPMLIILFLLALIVFSSSSLVAAKQGMKLWANNVVPALLPFFIAIELLSHTDIAQSVSIFFTNFMRPVFNVPGNGAYSFLLGIISGYPVGAKIVTDLRNNNMCTKDEGERMLVFTNNSGPLFIIGTIGVTLFRNSAIGFLLLITHILAAITVGIILGIISRLKKKSIKNNYKKYNTNIENINIYNMGEILSSSIMSSIKTIFIIGGFVLLFSVIISILNESNVFNILSNVFSPICNFINIDVAYIKPILTGILELTNGVYLLSEVASKNLTINILVCAFLLGFGGISILLQVLSIISKSDLSIKKYIYGKILQGIIASFYTYIFISSFCFLNFNL